ncbi:MAG: hypothetical protein QXT84_01020 [Candidatus Bathyarchaeia archaeon]
MVGRIVRYASWKEVRDAILDELSTYGREEFLDAYGEPLEEAIKRYLTAWFKILSENVDYVVIVDKNIREIDSVNAFIDLFYNEALDIAKEYLT